MFYKLDTELYVSTDAELTHISTTSEGVPCRTYEYLTRKVGERKPENECSDKCWAINIYGNRRNDKALRENMTNSARTKILNMEGHTSNSRVTFDY